MFFTIDDFSKFDPYAIKEFITTHLELRNPDEEFYSTITQAFLTGPETFAKLLLDVSDTDITYLAKGMAYTMHINGCAFPAINSDSYSISSIVKLIKTEYDSTENYHITTLYQEAATDSLTNEAISPYALPNVSIGNMSYTSGTLVVGQTETLQFSITETNLVGTVRTYKVEAYQRKGSIYTLKGSKNVTIPTDSNTVSVTMNVQFTETGSFFTYIKVLPLSGTNPLTTREGTYSDTVYGKWRINVVLPSNRSELGDLFLYKYNSNPVYSTECLGKSASNASPLVYYGNTPTGTYTGFLYEHNKDTYSYGPYKVINMTGVSGQIIESGRDGIWIHGGDPSESGGLRVTNGCVRVSNSAQLQLENYITDLISNQYHLSQGTINIVQTG